MKTTLIMGLLALQTAAMAETNWDQLVLEAPEAKTYRVELDKRFVEFDLVKFNSGKVRFNGFSRLSSKDKVKLVYHMKKKGLEEACRDYAELGGRYKFKAELVFKKGAVAKDFSFNLDGKTYSSADFDNQLNVGKVAVEELGATDRSPYTSSANDEISEYSELMNSAIENAHGDTVVVDLSKNLGIACDIGLGFIKPVVTQTISYEKAMPNLSYWIDQKSYNELYRLFNDEMKKVSPSIERDVQKFNEGLVLGWSLAQGNERLKDVVLKNGDKGAKLLKSLKLKGESSEATESMWRQTFDYAKPTSLMTNQKLSIVSGDVFVEVVNE
mgnify:CR=1 FL=1